MGSNLLRLFLLPYLSGLSCQLIKIFNHWVIGKKLEFTPNILNLGGLPSAHSAATITLTTLIAVYYGFTSPLFIIALFLSIFIMGEAYVVRGVISRHSELIKIISKVVPEKELTNTYMPGKIGHTPVEVIMGLIFGVFFALAFAGI